ncbi:HNH endonuclease [Photobacterium leiognathi]|uniref:HNH endonuclease n=1 Tax=Photobacterium leiognathi TaxID=553611 RepID=UPI0029821946|nr:HNH endonuclease signature motif containing protein [Photobacterium leiognathi]
MKKIKEFLDFVGADEEEALAAILGCFGISQPNATVQYWKRHEAYGKSAPTTQEVIEVYQLNDYRCQTEGCGSQKRLSLDHIDGNAKDHRVENLQLLCMSCNRKKSNKGTKDLNHQLVIYKAAMELRKELGRFPDYSEVKERAGVRQIGGVKYFLDYLKHRDLQSRT